MIKLRPYQQRAKDKLYTGWNPTNPTASRYQSQFLQLPTGAGKTIVFSDIAHDFIEMGIPVMILAHRKELIIQAHQKYAMCFEEHKVSDIIMSQYKRTPHSPLKIGSVQTVSPRLKKGKLNFKNEIGLIIVDEAHHVKSQTYLDILKAFPNALKLFVSATPYRLSGEGFKDVCQRLVTGPSVKSLEKLWRDTPTRDTGLVPDRVLPFRIGKGMQGVKKRGGEYDANEVSSILNTDQVCNLIVDLWIKHAKGKKTIAFCPKGSRADDKAMNQRLADTFVAKGIPAACVTAKTAPEVRDRYVKQLEDGTLTVLTNCEIFTEGFDLKGIEATILARPTMSLSLYLQMVGRGKRPAGPQKTEHILFDFVDNYALHGPPNQTRQWTLNGVSKRDKKDLGLTQVRHEGQLKFFDELPSNYNGPVYYEFVELKDMDRTRIYDQKLGNRPSPGKWKKVQAYLHFLKMVDCAPNLRELTYIAKSIGYNEKWAYMTEKNLRHFAHITDSMVDLGDYPKAADYLERWFTFPDRQDPTKRIKTSVYDTLKAKLDELLILLAQQ